MRKTRKQKAAFREELAATLEGMGWPVAVEKSGVLVKSHNVVAGNPEKAKIIFAAHYDTPARLPLPNFLAPKNLPVSLAWQLVVVLAILLPCALLFLLLALAGAPALVQALLSVGLAILLTWMMMAGPANPRNANDNTSGTLTLVQIAATLPPALRDKAALIFFDNEEKGMVGSTVYQQKHGELRDTLLLNFDCVGDGDHLLFVLPKPLRRDEGVAAALEKAFDPAAAGDEASKKNVLVDKSRWTLYPSDQMAFHKGVAVAAMRRAPGVGLYISRIHTGRDTVLEEENLLLLARGAAKLIEALPDTDA